MDNLTPEGMIVMQAFDAHGAHIMTHKCEDCVSGYNTILKAMTNWLNFNEEVSHGEGKKAEQGSQEQAQGKGEGETEPQGEGQKKDWDIF